MAIACRLSDTLQRQNQELEKELSRVNENGFIASLQKENPGLRAGRDGILTLLAIRDRLTSIQNGPDDFHNNLLKNHSPELIIRQAQHMK